MEDKNTVVCRMEALCREIHMPEQVTQTVLALSQTMNWSALAPALARLSVTTQWEAGLEELQQMPGGMERLTGSLYQALQTQEEYAAAGIPDDIFYATMGCFSRFVREHLESFGDYGFDRDWWTVRQLSARLFRIGQLEYELTVKKGRKEIRIHIPSDASLEKDKLRRSVQSARDFLARFFPDYSQAPMTCTSWLLSPTLQQLLQPDSRILQFQKNFRITPLGPGDSYMLWVFKRMDLPLEVLPENTSLQRRLKAYLCAGGIWEEAGGVLEEPI